jgi:DNA-binding MarR family transcriptional regulator/GNAT superfamily N-acetyltransferase
VRNLNCVAAYGPFFIAIIWLTKSTILLIMSIRRCIMADDFLAERVGAVRQFNRFYTRQIGVLNESLLESPFSLSEARVIYELAQRGEATASELGTELGLDAGYVSRMVRNFSERGLLERQPSPSDGRQTMLRLSQAGRKAFAELNERSAAQFAALLQRLPVDAQERLVTAMQTIEGILNPSQRPRAYLLRQPRPGDMGWVVQRHGALYAEEYGWDRSFEALVAEICASFLQNFDPAWERCWLAELEGQLVGSVFVVRQSSEVAKLRLLLVEPSARGLGIGKRLVQECIQFARDKGYRKITLWTNSVLVAARSLYEQAGFVLVEAEPHHSFGHDLVGENWDLLL